MFTVNSKNVVFLSKLFIYMNFFYYSTMVFYNKKFNIFELIGFSKFNDLTMISVVASMAVIFSGCLNDFTKNIDFWVVLNFIFLISILILFLGLFFGHQARVYFVFDNYFIDDCIFLIFLVFFSVVKINFTELE